MSSHCLTVTQLRQLKGTDQIQGIILAEIDLAAEHNSFRGADVCTAIDPPGHVQTRTDPA